MCSVYTTNSVPAITSAHPVRISRSGATQAVYEKVPPTIALATYSRTFLHRIRFSNLRDLCASCSSEGHRPAERLAVSACRCGEVFLHAAVGVIDATVQHQLRRALFQGRDRNLLQQCDRVVIDVAPQQRIDLAEQARGLVVPRPPEILRQRSASSRMRRSRMILSVSPRVPVTDVHIVRACCGPCSWSLPFLPVRWLAIRANR